MLFPSDFPLHFCALSNPVAYFAQYLFPVIPGSFIVLYEKFLTNNLPHSYLVSSLPTINEPDQDPILFCLAMSDLVQFNRHSLTSGLS
jgi:hypothetical protein